MRKKERNVFAICFESEVFPKVMLPMLKLLLEFVEVNKRRTVKKKTVISFPTPTQAQGYVSSLIFNSTKARHVAEG